MSLTAEKAQAGSESPRQGSSEHSDKSSDRPEPTNAVSEPVLVNPERSLAVQSDVERANSFPVLKQESRGSSPSEGSPSTSSRGQEDTAGGSNLTVSESMRRLVMWTMTGFFDSNPAYLIHMRGILNILHLIFSLVTIILLGELCKLSNYIGGPTDEFICKPPETFLFVVSISAFFTSTLYLFCCLLSKRTDALLFETSFEISYFVLYFIMFLTSSVTLMISAISWDTERNATGYSYETIQTAAVIGLVNSIIYGISAIWFFISHRYYPDPNKLPPRPTPPSTPPPTSPPPPPNVDAP